MKKIYILTILVLSSLLIAIPSFVQANLLAECHICNTSGKCDKCNGTAIMTCVNCNGGKESKCDQCSNGQVECHICNGKKELDCNCEGETNCPNCFGTKKQVCPQCNGNGTLACNSCKGSTVTKCNGCDGIGTTKCDSCKGSEKCVSCKGTGYLSGNNNGVNNIPKKGDTVQLLNGKTITWQANSSNSSSNDTSSNSDSSNNSKKVNKNESVVQNLTKDSNNSEPVKKDITQNTENNTIEDNTEANVITEQNDRSKIIIDNNNQKSIAKFDVEDMTESEKETFNTLPNDEFEEIVEKLDTIISSAKIGELSENSNEILEKILDKNNLSNKESIKLCKINFDGHISVGFPVNVVLDIDPNIFTEEDTVLAYHILEDNTIEILGDIKKYSENGKIIRAEFRTKSFSDFFLTTESLDLNLNMDLENEKTLPNDSQSLEQDKIKWTYIIAIAMVVILLVVVLILNIKKQKKLG